MRTVELDDRQTRERSNTVATVNARVEHELLLPCARTTPTPEIAARIRLLVRDDAIDWGYLARSAAAHGVLPLVCQTLSVAGLDAIPEPLVGQLKTASYASVGKNLFMTGELVKLLERFEDEEIYAIPFKGPVLAATAYGNLSLRQFCDLDILVHARDLLRARDVAIRNGYRLLSEADDTELVDAVSSPTLYNLTLVGEGGGPYVELHWGIAEKYLNLPLVGDFLWERCETVTVGGASMRNLAPADLLLILCVHGSRHCFSRLQWICDVAEVIRSRPDIDWDDVMTRAVAFHCRRMLFLGLRLAHDVLDAPLPAHIAAEVAADRVVASLAHRVHEQLFVEADGPRHHHDTIVSEEGLLVESISFHIGARERGVDRLRYLMHVARLALTPTKLDQGRTRVSAMLAFVPYLMRPFRLTKLYGLKYSARHVQQVLRQVVRGA